jgi:hypothetical protein
MVTGIAVLGVLAGSLSSFFRVGDTGDGSPGGEPAGPSATPDEAALATLTAEISALRLQVEFLTRRLTGTLPDETSGEPPPGQDTAPTPDA